MSDETKAGLIFVCLVVAVAIATLVIGLNIEDGNQQQKKAQADVQELITKHCRASRVIYEYLIYSCDNGEELARKWK